MRFNCVEFDYFVFVCYKIVVVFFFLNLFLFSFYKFWQQLTFSDEHLESTTDGEIYVKDAHARHSFRTSGLAGILQIDFLVSRHDL